ncbi:putative teichuronic acid biosynthesis glycosyltransferase TuaG [Fusobacterium necrophorum]|nr:glycosyltransferase family 2 protein [Fusobacterium necrophorum]MBR8734935.1 putative teichuronic acid biosynthesis glycosyltransferase TuaG [Fusobacterium necrophorum]MBR8791111.1 putative teichuronic acid biosynthesis glycosyltransferase TuaG [Fusobacterium necrophorum]
MFKENLVSIIMPSYNSEKYIEDSIKSVLGQTYKEWELIIIDDCSSDNTIDTIKKYSEKYSNIYLIELEENSGAAVARNQGIEIAQGEFIAFLDSDDLWKKEKLEIQINFMKENDCAFSFTEYKEIDDAGNNLNILIKVPENPITYRRYLLSNPIGCLTAVYSIKKLGKLYMPLIRKRQDAALWLKILKTGEKAYPIKQSLAKYRVRESSISANKANLIKYQWALYREIENLSLIESIFYLLCTIIVKVFKLKEKKVK